MLNNLSGQRLRGAICGLGMAGIGLHRILAYVASGDERVACAAIDALRRVGTEDEWRVIFPLLKHESASVRSAAIRFARAVLGDRAKEFLSNALTDPAPLVRENALDELDGLVTNDLRPIITSLLQDESPSVREGRPPRPAQSPRRACCDG